MTQGDPSDAAMLPGIMMMQSFQLAGVALLALLACARADGLISTPRKLAATDQGTPTDRLFGATQCIRTASVSSVCAAALPESACCDASTCTVFPTTQRQKGAPCPDDKPDPACCPSLK